MLSLCTSTPPHACSPSRFQTCKTSAPPTLWGIPAVKMKSATMNWTSEWVAHSVLAGLCVWLLRQTGTVGVVLAMCCVGWSVCLAAALDWNSGCGACVVLCCLVCAFGCCTGLEQWVRCLRCVVLAGLCVWLLRQTGTVGVVLALCCVGWSVRLAAALDWNSGCGACDVLCWLVCAFGCCTGLEQWVWCLRCVVLVGLCVWPLQQTGKVSGLLALCVDLTKLRIVDFGMCMCVCAYAYVCAL